MKFSARMLSLIVLLISVATADAQEPSKDESIQELIKQLGDDDFRKREEAEERLIESGTKAVDALRAAAKSTDNEVAFRAKRALLRITRLSLTEQAELRKQGDEALYAGDYDRMIRAHRRLVQAENSSIDDGRWLGHAYQLTSQWKKAADAYRGVLDRMDPLLDQGPDAKLNAIQRIDQRDDAIKQQAALILLTARIERHYLKDPVAAEKTLRRVLHYNEYFNQILADIDKKWRDRIAEAIETEKYVDTVGRDHRSSLSLRFPMFALRELAGVQQINGKTREALESWQRVHLTTRQYIGHEASIDTTLLDDLLQNVPEPSDLAFTAATVLSEKNATAEFDLRDPTTLAKSYDIHQNYWSFVLSPEPGKEFKTLEFQCDIEQIVQRYGGQFDCWILAGTQFKRKSLGSIGWPHDKEIGRAVITKKFTVEPGTGVVHFRAGSWKDKFKVHNVKVTASFRPRTKKSDDAPKPIPGLKFHSAFLPEGGEIKFDGEDFRNEVSRHGIEPGQHLLEYSHADLKEPRKFALDLQPGANYSLFLNLASPFKSTLTNLRGFHSHYQPSTNMVELSDDRWLVAWCDDGLRFSFSKDLTTWSEPTATSDDALFRGNYNCLLPTLYVDKEKTIWVAYFSNQLDIDQLSSGGYRLFLRHSKDGREWSPPRPIKMAMSGWPPGKIQIVDGPDGKVWMLYRMLYAAVNSPSEFVTLKKLDIPATNTQRSHARNPHATIDKHGQIHLVWDNFAQTLYYSRRDSEGKWSAPFDVSDKVEGRSRYSHPQLVIRGDKIAMLYNSNQSSYLQRGTFNIDGLPAFGKPIKITPHNAPLITANPSVTPDGRIIILCGNDTVWSRAASVDELLRGTNK